MYIFLVDVIESKVLKWYIIFNDILIVLFYTFILTDTFHNAEELSSFTETNCVRLVISAIVSNFIFSIWQLFQVLKTCLSYLRNRIKIHNLRNESHETMADASKSTSGMHTIDMISETENDLTKERTKKKVTGFAVQPIQEKVINLEALEEFKQGNNFDDLNRQNTENIVVDKNFGDFENRADIS